MPRPRPAVSYVEFLPEFGRAVRIREYDRPMQSDDVETAQTVELMDEIAATDANDPAIRNAAAEALDDAGINENAPAIDKARAVFWWLKRTVRYVPVPGTSRLVDQTLITPCTVLAMPEPIGDCPQFSMLASAIFRVLCMDSMFITIKAEDAIPDQWSHIYNTVEVQPGRYMPFDSSNGPEPGAEYARPFDKKVWPRIAPGKCSERSKEAMHRVTGRPMPSMRNASLRGALGDTSCDETGYCYDLGSAPSGGDLMTGPPVNLNDRRLSIDGSGSFGGGTPSWLNTLLSDAESLGTTFLKSQLTPKPYYMTGPTGQPVLYNPSTGRAVPSGVGGSLNIGGSLSPTVIMLGILGIGAIALLKGK